MAAIGCCLILINPLFQAVAIGEIRPGGVGLFLLVDLLKGRHFDWVTPRMEGIFGTIARFIGKELAAVWIARGGAKGFAGDKKAVAAAIQHFTLHQGVIAGRGNAGNACCLRKAAVADDG